MRLPCGSASISKTLLPVFARPTPRLTVVVVLPDAAFLVRDSDNFTVFHAFSSFLGIHSDPFLYRYVPVRYLSSTPHAHGNTSDACLRNKSMGISPLPGSPPAP